MLTHENQLILVLGLFRKNEQVTERFTSSAPVWTEINSSSEPQTWPPKMKGKDRKELLLCNNSPFTQPVIEA